jgi:hypothetical protein
MQLYDPTVAAPESNNRRAPVLASLEGKTIAILENGKLNANAMLTETAALFEARHGCTILPIHSKVNASAPAPDDTIAAAAAEADFVITGLGD